MGCTQSIDGNQPNKLKNNGFGPPMKPLQDIDHEKIKMVLEYWYN